MKRIPLFFMTLLFPIIVQGAEPTPSAPKMINLQAVLVDDGGNVLYDKQEADIVFSVIDGDGETLYEEVQHVPIVNGAISVLIGNGKNVATGEATGGIPMEALIPDGSKLLRIKLNEQSIPQEDLQLVSVPYALYAESLSHPIESDEVLDGTLVQADLSAELVSSLENSMTTLNTNSLATHRTESGAHPARSISVENNFTHASGTDLQTVLSGLDSAIGMRRNQEGELVEDIGDEVTARTAADTAEATTRAAGDDEVRASEISRAGDTIYGDLTFYTDDTLTTQTMSIAPSTGDITTQGQVSALGGMFTIELDPVSSEPIISIDNTGGVETYRFEAETGSLTLLGDLTMADADILMSPGRLVDGVDISALALRVGAVEIRLPPGGTPLDDIYVNETGDTMTGPLTATSFTGDGANITNIAGGNIQSETVTTTQIQDGTVATTDMASPNISQWTNDSEYITDGNTNWNNEYGFITDGNEGWNNSYGFITDGNEGWNNSYGFVTDPETVSISGDELLGDLTFNDTSCMNAYGHNCQLDGVDVSALSAAFGSHHHDGRYVRIIGDIMTGGLGFQDPGACTAIAGNNNFENDPDCLRVDNIDVSELADKVEKLEDDQPSSSATAFAYGHCNLSSLSNANNVTSCSQPATGTIRVNFDTDPGATNYTVVVTPTGSSPYINHVSDKEDSYFEVRNNNPAVSFPVQFDFVVYLP